MQYQTNKIFREYAELSSGCSLLNLSDFQAPFFCNLSYRVGDIPENVNRSRSIFCTELKISPDGLAELEQVHGDIIVNVKQSGLQGQADGMMTNLPGIALGIYTADCLPVLIYDPVQRCIAAVHSGWKGTALQIAAKTVKALTAEYGSQPHGLRVWIGPGICGKCYEVGADVADHFAAEYKKSQGDKFLLNLKKAVLDQLIAAGVSENNIEVCQDCTLEDKENYHSYRRDNIRAGRNLTVIMLKVEK